METLGFIEVAAFIYCLISVPKQLFERYKKKRNGQVYTPTKIIVKKLLKSWLITGVFLIPSYLYGFYEYAASTGAPDSVIGSVMVSALIVSIRDTILFGYIFMMLFRHKWSYSANQWNFNKINGPK